MGNYCCGGGEDGVEPDSHHNVSAEVRIRSPRILQIPVENHFNLASPTNFQCPKSRFSFQERRRLAAEAAQKRIREAEGRGMRDPEGFKQRQANKEKVMAEAMEQGQGQPSGGLKVRSPSINP